jgi:hypothetical protein
LYMMSGRKIKEAARATATAATVPEVKEEQKISKRTR